MIFHAIIATIARIERATTTLRITDFLLRSEQLRRTTQTMTAKMIQPNLKPPFGRWTGVPRRRRRWSRRRAGRAPRPRPAIGCIGGALNFFKRRQVVRGNDQVIHAADFGIHLGEALLEFLLVVRERESGGDAVHVIAFAVKADAHDFHRLRAQRGDVLRARHSMPRGSTVSWPSVKMSTTCRS